MVCSLAYILSKVYFEKHWFQCLLILCSFSCIYKQSFVAIRFWNWTLALTVRYEYIDFLCVFSSLVNVFNSNISLQHIIATKIFCEIYLLCISLCYSYCVPLWFNIFVCCGLFLYSYDYGMRIAMLFSHLLALLLFKSVGVHSFNDIFLLSSFQWIKSFFSF